MSVRLRLTLFSIGDSGVVDAHGANGPWATFIISPQNGYVRFQVCRSWLDISRLSSIHIQNVGNPNHFLAVRDGMLTWGPGGPFCG